MTANFTPLLNAVEGVAYTTDPHGVLTACGQPGWDRALTQAGSATRLDASAMIGRSLFDFIAGEDVRESYRRHMALLAEPGRRPRVFQYRCDSPDMARVLRMAISALRGPDDALTGYLFQSVVVSVTDRVPIDLFAFPRPADADADLPFLGMCSYCQQVRFPAGCAEGDGTWVGAIDYYRHGGDNAVAISHGVCPTCFDTVVQDNLKASLTDSESPRPSPPDAAGSAPGHCP